MRPTRPGLAPSKEILFMTDRNLSSARSRLARLAGALAIGTALIGVPAAFAADAGTPAAAATPAAPAAAPAPKPTDVVAKVGSETVTEGDLGLAAEDLQQQLQNVPPQDQKAFLTGVMIDMQLMAQAARGANLDQSPDYKAQLAYLQDRALRQAYFESEIAKQITPDTIKAAYDGYVKAFQPQDQIHAEHILVKTQAEAEAIEKQLSGGAKFEDLAKSKSIDTGSAAQGGDLGFFAKGQMVKPFEDAAFALNVGQVSQPVQSQYGWHVIKIIEKRKTQPQTFDQMAPQLQQQVIFKKFDAAIEALKAKTTIEIPDASLAAQVKAENDANQQAGQAAPAAPDSSGQ
jgi:peptidyl-prolyl cis-trans isomerase C